MRLAIALTVCLLAARALAQESEVDVELRYPCEGSDVRDCLGIADGDIRVIDGDTFQMDGQTIRLWGIDAPELGQTCGDYQAGAAASAALRGLLDGDVPCEFLGADQYGATVARCFLSAAGDRNSAFSLRADIGGLLVAAGHAWDWPRFSGGEYGDAEGYARAGGEGVWAYDCVPAWEWRARN